MATSSVPKVEACEENQLSFKLTGDLQDVQITEEDLEESDSDDNEDSSSSRTNALGILPQSLVLPSDQPTYGTVQVTDSENVHFGDRITGDNIVFNIKGPVVIKQLVHPKEQDNPGYEQTEDDIPTHNDRNKKTDTNEEAKIKPSNIKLWLKLSFSAVCIVMVGGVCAIVSTTLMYTGHKTATTTSSDEQDSSAECLTVEGFPYWCLKCFMMSVLFVMLILFSGAKLLTTGEGANTPITVKPNRIVTKKRDSGNVKVDPPLISSNHLRIVSRIDWLAQPVEQPLDVLRLPVPWVIIQHTATESCHSQSECILSVRLIQMFHVESRGWFDIGYNFLVAGDGSAYYGRGWDNQGAHTLGYNRLITLPRPVAIIGFTEMVQKYFALEGAHTRYSIGIAFIGTFNNEPPPKIQLDACKKLIQRGLDLGKIAKDYKLFAHRQLASTLSPGDKLVEILREWPHYVQNDTDIDSLLPEETVYH